MVNVFVSHAHADAALAAAFKNLVITVFDEVDVDYSSDPTAGGGIEAGANWLEWIQEKVRTSNLAVVVVTPESSRPWLMWESGAVAGMALALEQRRRIAPLLFRVNRDNVSGPLRHLQAEQGETEQGIRRVVLAVWEQLGRKPDQDRLDRRLSGPLATYLAEVGCASGPAPVAGRGWCPGVVRSIGHSASRGTACRGGARPPGTAAGRRARA